MNIPGKSVEIKCRRCGKTAKAEDFALDYVYKMAVCPSCIKERKANDSKTIKQSVKEAETQTEAPKKIHPPGWDAEDEYLEKLARQKQKGIETPQQPTPDSHHMSGINRMQTSSYSSPKPQTVSSTTSTNTQSSKPMSVADFGMRGTAKPTSQQSTTQPNTSQSSSSQSKPMGLSDFGMRAATKTQAPEQPHASTSQSTQSSKPMGIADFGMRSSGRAESSSEHLHQEKSAVATEREGKSSSDPDKMKYKCKKCNYEFYYNRERNMPRACPYCNTQVMHLL